MYTLLSLIDVTEQILELIMSAKEQLQVIVLRHIDAPLLQIITKRCLASAHLLLSLAQL